MLKLLFLRLVGGSVIGMLGRAHRYITLHSANADSNAIYISMIRPILEYCAGAWACCVDFRSSAEASRKNSKKKKTSSS